jgi:hypothetical protein
MKRLGLSIVAIVALAALIGCAPRDSSASRSGYSAEISNVVTKLQRESVYPSLGTKTVSYNVTGDIALKSAGEDVPDSGELVISISETTGFSQDRDQPSFMRIPILNGKGRIRIDYLNTEYPASKATTPPKIAFRFANFNKLESVVVRTEGSDALSANALNFEVVPIGIKSEPGIMPGVRSYTANYEVNIVGGGTLSQETFSLFVLKTALEHSDANMVGNSQTVQYFVNNGTGKIYETEYLGTVLGDQRAPAAPRFQHQVLGIIREADTKIIVK